ncbi:MAG: mycofactocin biosynthesis chaperone MftB [Acidimicrobiales bacterium]
MSTEPPAPATGARSAFDPGRPYRLAEQVALRTEPFGALAYHYGNRRLTFLRDPVLADLVRDLHLHPSAADAVEAATARTATTSGPGRRTALTRALAALAGSEVIRAT